MMNKHHEFMDRPIPDLSDLRLGKSAFRTYKISPVSEECVRINQDFLCRSYYWDYDPRPDGATEDIFLRKELVLKLKEIDRNLGLVGLRLLIKEGYRPLSVQHFVREVSVVNGLRKEKPGLSDSELYKLAGQFASPADTDLLISPPPHITGGAVDLSIVHLGKCEKVDMGKTGGLYNTAFPDALEESDPAQFAEARRFRRLLFWLASEQGIVTNPTEWWHLCYGDQMWAWATKAPSAIYGVAENFK